jgi:hypothetical protein
MGGQFLEEVLQGWAVDWANCHVPTGEVDCMLMALGLLHMRVKCVIPEELGGDYESQVSACGVGMCMVCIVLTVMPLLPSPLVGHRRDIGGVNCPPSVHLLF